MLFVFIFLQLYYLMIYYLTIWFHLEEDGFHCPAKGFFLMFSQGSSPCLSGLLSKDLGLYFYKVFFFTLSLAKSAKI